MKNILIGIILLLSLHACKRSTDVLGPLACPTESFVATSFVFKDFVTGDPTNLDLLADSAQVAMTFNESISYQVTITGSASGAQYVYNGKGTSVNLMWYGLSTNGKYFIKGEVLICKITNLCEKEPLGSGQMTLTTIVGYIGGPGLTLDNYETYHIGGYGPWNINAYASDPSIAPTNRSFLITSDSAGYVASPQGGSYFKYKAVGDAAHPANPPYPNAPWTYPTYIGGYYFGGYDYSYITAPTFAAKLPSDPTRVYFNFYAKGTANSQAQFLITERLHNTDLTRKAMAPVSDGWVKYSFKLSDIGVTNPKLIKAVSFNLGTVNPSLIGAEVNLDLVIFTVDQPL